MNIRVAGIEPDSYLPCECRRVDELQRTRERARGLAELSPEQRSYDVQQAIRDGRMSEYRDELDLADNVSCGTVATAVIVGVGVAGAISVMLSVMN